MDPLTLFDSFIVSYWAYPFDKKGYYIKNVMCKYVEEKSQSQLFDFIKMLQIVNYKNIQINNKPIPMIKQKLTKIPKVKVDAVLIDSEEVNNLVANHSVTVKAIVDTYEDLLDVLGDGVKTEMLASVDNLTDSINSLPSVDHDLDFDQLADKLDELDARDIETARLLAMCDEDEILDWVKTNKPGYILVKTESPDVESKIRHFLETQIYPHYNDQRKNILF